MTDVAAIALSGLKASVAQFSAAASNVVHLNDAGSVPAPPSAPPPPAANGPPGAATSYPPKPPSPGSAYDPASLYADDKGEAAQPTVNLAEEMVKIAMALQTFRANIAVLKTADKMTRSALDILS